MKKDLFRLTRRYRLLQAYLTYVHDHFYYRHLYVIGKENIPPDGVPTLIVSDHQNGLNDPLLYPFTIFHRKVSIFARGDVFKNPVVAKFLRFLGVIPTYRRAMDGIAAVNDNLPIFDMVEEKLIDGCAIGIYPESMNQDKRWLGNFSPGYLKLVFDAAAKADFKKDIVILPSCNHYENYFHMQADALVEYGEPISVAPYYPLYQENPREARRVLNKLVRQKVEEMMLNISDLEHYTAIDFIRNSYGKSYAKRKGLRPDYLPDKLKADKMLVASLAEAHAASAEGEEEVYALAEKVEKGLDSFNLRDWNCDSRRSRFSLLMEGVWRLIQLPLFLFSLIPNLLIYLTPNLVIPKLKTKMFYSSIRFGISALVSIPLVYTLDFILVWIFTSWWIALAHVIIMPWLGLYAWNYYIGCIKYFSEWRFRRVRKTSEMKKLLAERQTLQRLLDDILFRR